MKTSRGFEINHFYDDYDIDCSIQESSSAEPHVWLGVHTPKIKIMSKDIVSIGKDKLLEKIEFIPYSSYNPKIGWSTIKLPEEMCIFSRMHLNKEEARQLADKLYYFSVTGRLPEGR